MTLSMSKGKERRKPRPPKPPNITTWLIISSMITMAMGWWKMGTHLIGEWEYFIVSVVISFITYWYFRRYRRWSMWHGKPTWMLVAASLGGYFAYCIFGGIDIIRAIKNFGDPWD